MEALATEYAGIASFFTVWCREAHAGGDYPQPTDMEARAQYARAFCAADEPTIPIVLDDLQGSLQSALGGFPNCVYIVDPRGRVAYRANWTDAREVGRVLARLRTVAERLAAGDGLGMPRWSEEMLPALHDDPTAEVVTAIKVWEEARNFDEPERFMGEHRAQSFREAYMKATGTESVRG